MKILEVVSYLYPSMVYGGPAKVVYEMSRDLAFGNRVTIYTTDVWDEKSRIPQKKKLKNSKDFEVFYFRNIFNSLAFRYRFFTGLGMVFAYIGRHDEFDIVHIHDVYIIPQLLIGILAILYKRPYLVTPHGVLDPLRAEQKSFLKSIVYHILARYVLSRAKLLVATSDQEKKDLLALGFKNVEVVFNGISMNIEKPSTKFEKFRDESLFTILYIGKIHPLKGLDCLLAALKDVKFRCRLLVAGPDDGARGNLEKITSRYNLKDVHFLNYVDEKEKSELFSIADLFVYPSRSEGFSISILEAIKYKVPVLITSACNFPDIASFKAGFVLPNKNLDKSLRVILSELNNKRETLKRFGENGRRLIEERYSIKLMAKKMDSLYREL